ncbi:TrmH family RNA methyltransferase [Pasteurellaceae bacterium 22721_9_1]
MNNSKSSRHSKPTFQTASDNKRFQERSVSARTEFAKQAAPQKKRSKNGPQFSFQKAEQPKTLIKEGNFNGVQVRVKSQAESAKVKKTGPLSPRAPEKIKKNRAEEMKVFGENACLTLFAQRPESIVRVWATVEMSHKIGDVFSYLAANKKAYHVVDREELELVSGSEHHNGICMLVKKQRPFSLAGYLDVPKLSDCLLMLDGVANNPQNIGGIVRTCAFYGVKGIVTSSPDLLFSANAARVAEGGLEYINVLQTEAMDSALSQLRKAGYQIVHLTSAKNAKNIHSVRFNDKVVFVLAHEGEMAEKQDEVVNLSLANPLKIGLNVAVATGILLAKWVAR